MKKLGFIPILVASSAGVLVALQADKYIERTRERSGVEFRTASAPLSEVQFGGAGTPFDFRAAAKKVSPSVVSIDRFNLVSDLFSPETFETKSATASGVILSTDGIVVTNNHVVANAERVGIRLSDGRSANAKVLGSDVRSDIAVLKIDLPKLTPIEVASSKNLQVGEWVMAVGNPLGFDNTVSVGVVSSLKRNLPTPGGQTLVDAIQTDAAINPGNSGGALCNAAGQLVGINTVIASPTGVNAGIGFAIPVDRVRAVAQDIVKVGRVRYAALGVTYPNRWEGLLANPQARAELSQRTGGSNVPTYGILVAQSRGAAAAAGVEAFDVLLELDGQKLESFWDLNRVLVYKKPGDTATLKYWSRGEVKTVKLTLQELEPTPDL